ncbi:hypothetical protein [Spirosoma daeguense]
MKSATFLTFGDVALFLFEQAPMADKVSERIKWSLAESKRIFLIDGIGAFITAFFLVAVLARLESNFGLSPKLLYVLASIASLFALYSLSCYVLPIRNWRKYVAIISVANLLYCLLTASLVIYHYNNLTILGLLYFTLEILIILGLVHLERKLLSQRSNK